MLFFTPPLSLEAPPVNAHEVPVAPERPQPTAASPRTLLSIAGVSVMYYDAVGSDISKLHDWLEKHGSLDPQTHKVPRRRWPGDASRVSATMTTALRRKHP